MKRVFLIVLDSVGIGEAPDAKDFGDEGSNTLYGASTSSYFSMPNMERLGLFSIDGVTTAWKTTGVKPIGTYAKMTEASKGKDTTIGHWEIAGIISPNPLPTYPNGFPEDLLKEFERRTGRGILCNQPYSGTEVIKAYGKEQKETGKWIVYTSADSVFQIAADEHVIPLEELYEGCKIAREILSGEHGVGRVIARPYVCEDGEYKRTTNRHDFSLLPPKETILDVIKDNGMDVIGIGKIHDIFAGKGLTEFSYSKGNADGINQTIHWLSKDFCGLCFVNLVDYDMLYGHRNDVDGYAKALTEFDQALSKILDQMKEGDVLMITADHGCDPTTPSTNHSREFTPFVMYQYGQRQGHNLGTRKTFADIGATVLGCLGIDETLDGANMLEDINEI